MKATEQPWWGTPWRELARQSIERRKNAMREDKTHPAGQPAQVHSCADCGRTAVLTIFRNEGLCHSCRTGRDVEVVKRVADKEKNAEQMKADADARLDAALVGGMAMQDSVMSRAELSARTFDVHSYGPSLHGLGTIEVLDDDDRPDIVPETVIYCDKCATHRVAEIGQVCPVCNGHRG